jgi:ribosomal protein L35
MDDQRTFEGLWRLPPKRRRIAGTATFTEQDGARLRLRGAFVDWFERADRAKHTIQGVTSAGQPITIIDCHHIRQSFGRPPQSEYHGPQVFVGRHFKSADDVRFRSVSISYFNLTEFIGTRNFSLKLDREAPSRFSIHYRKSRATPLRLGKFTVTVAYSWKTTGDSMSQAGIEQRAWFTATSPTRRPLNEFLSGPFRTLHTLLELATENSIPIETIEADHSKRRMPVEILLQPVRLSHAPTRRHSGEMLFTFNSLGKDLEKVVQRWHVAREKYGPTFDLYFALGRSQMFLEHQFLTLIQAIEAYHRRAFSNDASDPAAHATRVRHILQSVGNTEELSKSDRQWLYDRIKYNEPTLAGRLRELYSTLPLSVHSVVGAQGKFAQTISQTRHYMTHWSEEARERALQGPALLRPIQQLRLMTKLIFLRELGIANDNMTRKLHEFKLLPLL